MATETKHTPGPWEYVKSHGEDAPRVLSEHVNKGGNFHVAVCNVDDDARLIASAPDMLKVLQSIISHDDGLKPEFRMVAAMRRDIERVIRLAVGE